MKRTALIQHISLQLTDLLFDMKKVYKNSIVVLKDVLQQSPSSILILSSPLYSIFISLRLNWVVNATHFNLFSQKT